ncbi:MAG: hypothetical protein U1F34_00825 [Gammaproteobacteria bacterium]
MSEIEDKELSKRVSAALEESTCNLDVDTLRRLRLARHAATDELATRMQRRAGYAWWMPAGAFAAAAIAVVALTLWQRGAVIAPHADMATAEDIDILSDDSDAQIALDMEFYQWLEVVDETG